MRELFRLFLGVFNIDKLKHLAVFNDSWILTSYDM